MRHPDHPANIRDVRCLAAAGVPYASARAWQDRTASAVRAVRTARTARTAREMHDLREPSEAVAFIEHTAVYTMGARGGRATLRLPATALPAPIVDSDRGGDVTWHGPGQLVAYPILDLRRRGMTAAAYIAALEAMLLDTLAAFGVAAGLTEGRRGVWVGPANEQDKIAAIGVRVQGGVSLHGIALNVAPDLTWFDPIVPCGLDDAGVTSMARVLGRDVTVDEVRPALREAFARRFDARLVDLPADEACSALGAPSREALTREAPSREVVIA